MAQQFFFFFLNNNIIITLNKIMWGITFRVTKESDHVVLFTFDNQIDLERVLNTEPWSFDKHLMIFHRYDKEVDVIEIDFNMVTFWIQVHNLPVRF